MIRIFLPTVLILFVGVSVGGQEAIVDEPEIMAADRQHWAYLPIERPEIPQVKFVQWPQTDIDHFILARLEADAIRPASRADQQTLLRRVYLDLIGIPPTPAQVKAFGQDNRPDAYRRVVESLLASPEYGRRWGQYWLDLARFAETDGYEHDKVRPTAWQYRDWVIDALNADMSYDQFVRWQIAGDLIEPHDPRARIATAFCLSGPDMPDINSMAERKHVLLNEITATVGAALISLQVGCAQCHDHMYDAISQADFYRLRAYFDSAVELKKNQSVTVLASHQTDSASHLMIRGDWRRRGPEVQPAVPRVASVPAMASVPSVVGPTPDKSSTDPQQVRMELANWLTDRRNPLTARTIVNRLWQHHFGVGLSATPSDFGVMGDEPSHPELLDYLADELMRSDWSLKHLHRQIVLSAVYLTRSTRPTDRLLVRYWDAALAADGENRLLSRFPRRRLDAETLRDCLFAVSGSLDHEVGGPGVYPPLPAEMIKTLLSGQWKTSEREADHYRRSIYIFARRNLRYPLFGTFDRPAANASCAVRSRSTTAVQALLLFNSEITLDAATRLAKVLTDQAGESESQIKDLYLRVFSRKPTAIEVIECQSFLQQQQELLENDPQRELKALTNLCRALLNANEFIYID